MRATGHRCPVTGCTVIDVPRSKLMCGAHWARVPGDLASALYRAYRNRSEDRAGHLQACEDCIAAVEGREPRELFG